MRRVINNVRHHKNWLDYYRQKYFGSMESGFRFSCRVGVQIDVPKRLLPTYKECFFDDSYFKGFPKEIASRQMGNVVDIGANVGYFSLALFSQHPQARVIAYEPMANNFRLLQDYTGRYPDFNWTVVNEAVSSEAGTLKLHFDGSDSFTTAATVLGNTAQPDVAEVHCTTLEQLVQDQGLDTIDFLKLDCEGSEYAILYGASPEVLGKIKAMSVETHNSNQQGENIAALSKFLQDRGFGVVQKRSHLWAWK